MDVQIYSRKEIEKRIQAEFPPHTAVISFYDPPGIRSDNQGPVDYKGKPDMLLQVAIFDIDKEILPDYGLTYDTYLPEADHIAAFVKEAVNKGDAIICQCNYGQSRSAACAAAILEHYEKRGIDIFRDYRYYPNQLVFNKIYEALEK